MMFYRLLYVVVQIGLPLTADQYIGVCGSDKANKYCFALSTWVKNGKSDISTTFLVNDTYSNVVCPTNVRTAEALSFANEFNLYSFDLQCSDTDISIFLPLDNAPMSYQLKPFSEVSGTSFSLLTECYILTCRCIIINLYVTTVHIHTIPSRSTLTIETMPTNMTNVNQTYTMTKSLEMIVVTGPQPQLSNTYVNSNDPVTVFCMGDSMHAVRGILQLTPFVSSTTTVMVPLPLPAMSNITYRTMSKPGYQSERYIVMVCVNGSDLVPSDWYRFVPDFNSNFTYYLMTVTWSNVSGSILKCPEARRYQTLTFRKPYFVFSNLTMNSTRSSTISSTESATTFSYQGNSLATGPEPGFKSSTSSPTTSSTNSATTFSYQANSLATGLAPGFKSSTNSSTVSSTKSGTTLSFQRNSLATVPGTPPTTPAVNYSGGSQWPYKYIVGVCVYRCNLPVIPINVSDPVQREMLQKQLKELRKQLEVNKTGLSSTRRRKESAIDHRMSAKAVGLVGTAMLCTCIGVIILADLLKMSKIILDIKARFSKSDTIKVKPSKMRRPSRIRKQSEAKIVPFIQSNRVSDDTSV